MNTSGLIFVYNADSGIFNALLDSLHKTFSPKTYNCNLCAITYTSVSMKKQWKDFISKLNVPVLFLHRDELERKYGITDLQLPVLLANKGTHFDKDPVRKMIFLLVLLGLKCEKCENQCDIRLLHQLQFILAERWG
jgi:hypothetical protein